MTEARRQADAGRGGSPAVLKVLIIDPNPGHRDLLKDLVRQVKFVDSVTDRGSPQHVLNLLAQNPVHVIMISEDLLAGDVFEVIRTIRSKPVGARTRFVLVGDVLEEETRRKGTEAGCVAFLKRPYDQRRIEQALRDAAGARPAAAPAAAAMPSKLRDELRDMLERLHRVSLFTGFTDQELVRLLKICRTRRFGAGSYVFREGEKGYSLYVLVSGNLEIRTGTGEAMRVLVHMSPGDCFGEMAIIDAEPRSADAVAATDCIAIEVNESVVNNNEDMLSLKLVRQIAILLAKKLRQQSMPRSR